MFHPKKYVGPPRRTHGEYPSPLGLHLSLTKFKKSTLSFKPTSQLSFRLSSPALKFF